MWFYKDQAGCFSFRAKVKPAKSWPSRYHKSILMGKQSRKIPYMNQFYSVDEIQITKAG